MEMNYKPQSFRFAYGANGPLIAFFNSVEPNVEPSPTFDIEINKEDKDKDVDKPSVKKDPDNENTEDEEAP